MQSSFFDEKALSMRDYQLKNDVEILSHEIAFKRFYQMEIYRLRYRLFNGGWSETVTRDIANTGQVSAVLPYDPLRNKVVLIEQFRAGTLVDEKSPWMLEIVAGLQEINEDKAALAGRELKEETNLEATTLMPICRYWESPGASNKQVDLYCGLIDSSHAGGIQGVAHEHEDIRVHVLDAEESFKLVRQGFINNSLSIIALQWLELNLDRMRNK